MNILEHILSLNSISSVSCCSLSSLFSKMTKEQISKTFSLCPNAKSVVFALFPYFSGDEIGNISKYARGTDYHSVIEKSLFKSLIKIKKIYPQNSFIVLSDNSPLPEVFGAYISGCGILGKNGLIFDKKYGSYVFIGTILTDLHIEPTKGMKDCIGCNACIKACPTDALSGKGVCLSELTQKGGELSPKEAEQIKKSPLIWGCDTCSDVCPMNKNILLTENPAFVENKINTLTIKDVENLSRRKFIEKYPNRAFTWKGPSPIKRNLRIKEEL